MTRKLARPVTVRGKHYSPGDELSDDIAALITNPRAWGESAGADREVRDPDTAGEQPAPPTVQEPVSPWPNRPAGNAGKDAWVAFAVGQGMDRDEAKAMSRDDLRDRFPEA